MAELTGGGAFEVLITEALQDELAHLDPNLVRRDALRDAEAPDRIALLVSRVMSRVVSALDEDGRSVAGVAVAREVIGRLAAGHPTAGVEDDLPIDTAEVLHSIARRAVDGSARHAAAPLIPMLDTTLLTNARGEPSVGRQIIAEIESADRVDVLMAFVRLSGIKPMEQALRAHCAAGRRLRVLTTVYTGSTERAALDTLVALGAEVRISYDTSTTRLHAKSWLFHRASGFSTAYVGSSNLTHSAQVAGLEWNVRVSGARNPDVIDKVGAVVESYWESDDFVAYDPDQFDAATAKAGPRLVTGLSPIEITLKPFQERLLEQIAVARAAGHHRNLLVAATGTGKTVMAAVDYVRLRAQLPSARLLVIAHRRELLDQALHTYRHALRDADFGELWLDGQRPRDFDHVFASIQSLSANGLAHLDPAHFDVVVVDEFHHAAAPSYEAVLRKLRPRELLGLTATPERSDGLDILHWFGDRIAAELRVWDAIDQHLLTPFAYYGIADGIDLTSVPWQRGRGYEVDALTNVYTSDDAWARRVLTELVDHVGDLAGARVLAFCVSVAHADFMARRFREAGVAAVAINGTTPAAQRQAALDDLARGHVTVFSVDLFNEGVDLPTVNTLLLLRPTDSAVLFLQQLGRGLRRAADKPVTTVLDFVAQHRKEYRFDRRLRGLFGGTRKGLIQQIENGFPFLPAGCSFQLDRVAQDIVLRSVKNAVPSRWPDRVDELRAVARQLGDPTLGQFLDESGLDLEDVYTTDRTWTQLRLDAGLPVPPAGPDDTAVLRAVRRLLHVDDRLRLGGYARVAAATAVTDLTAATERERRLARMLTTTLLETPATSTTTLAEGLTRLRQHPRVLAELRDLMPVLASNVDHLHGEIAPDEPLRVHARYARREILAALGAGDPGTALTPPWREGVMWVEAARTDAFLVTLDKSGGGFSPTTRYRDYAISPTLFHWESKSTTSADSPTGRRYREHVARGSTVLLFVRRTTDEEYWCVGPAAYAGHEGSRPMAVTWRLQHRLPGDLFADFSAAVA